ncbi:MAG: hypothetical protein GYA87_03850 [Christensenellaceae bacterium]|nr:hypothetical protein [Christensenellaceae bacterium]
MKILKRNIALLLILIILLTTVNTMAQENAWNEDDLNSFLNQLAEDDNNGPWQKAIYYAGAENLTLDNDVLTFFLRGFTPNVNSLPKLKEDPKGWFDGFFANISEYSLEASLTFEDGNPTKKSITKLKNIIENAASKAKGAFRQQTVKTALLDLLFPIPYKDATTFKKGVISPEFYQWMSLMNVEESQSEAYSALLYAQTNHQINFDKGPHALEYSIKINSPENVLIQGENVAIANISKIQKANSMDVEQIKSFFKQGLLEAAGTLRKSTKETQSFTVDIDQLAIGNINDDYLSFLKSFTLTDSFNQFEEKVRDLPDYPALDFPKNGRISGTTSGTKIIIKTPRDEYARYIQIRSTQNDNILVDLFIRPGGKATVRAPQGMCYLLIAMGNTWYGEDELFGKDTIMSKTDDLEIKSSRYYHTLTLGGVEDGNLRIWDASKDMFKKK